jgi:stringent starvation protein B
VREDAAEVKVYDAAPMRHSLSAPRLSLVLVASLFCASCGGAPPPEPVAPAPTVAIAPAPPETAQAEPPPAKPAVEQCIPVGRPKQGKPPVKKAIAETITRAGALLVHLDARRPDVVVPSYLKRDGHLVLQVGHDLEPPIPDLRIDEQGISGTLSFKHLPFHVTVPWAAIYGLVDKNQQGTIWDADVPEDMRCK